ncbi:hypothetical protein CIT292_09893 [Citrobacter youngae ATCC 29220]|uniref:Uncharacterized protein n=1 Tax=Citrobacter youngae ATCC 29220 TaxID=500640 RepID=D4BH86_9ENTR|nr:hypothetical protein CIT292_09893 [Citrobacter youngae ATCC 29220]
MFALNGGAEKWSWMRLFLPGINGLATVSCGVNVIPLRQDVHFCLLMGIYLLI